MSVSTLPPLSHHANAFRCKVWDNTCSVPPRGFQSIKPVVYGGNVQVANFYSRNSCAFDRTLENVLVDEGKDSRFQLGQCQNTFNGDGGSNAMNSLSDAVSISFSNPGAETDGRLDRARTPRGICLSRPRDPTRLAMGEVARLGVEWDVECVWFLVCAWHHDIRRYSRASEFSYSETCTEWHGFGSGS